METPPTPTPIVVRGQAAIDALTRAAFTACGYPTCACGATIDERGETTCYPCRAGNRRAWLYGGSELRPEETSDARIYAARIAGLQQAIVYWRDRARALAGSEALGAEGTTA